MDILIAENDHSFSKELDEMLTQWGYNTVLVDDGQKAWEQLQKDNSPRLIILDWMMPKLEGVEVCKKFRENNPGVPAYFILLTSKGNIEDIVKGLDSGADDYVTKPFNFEELKVRVENGKRLLELQIALNERVSQLEENFSQIWELESLLPICSVCKKIRGGENYWHQLEKYIGDYADVNFSHGICPDCYEKHVVPQLEKLKARKKIVE